MTTKNRKRTRPLRPTRRRRNNEPGTPLPPTAELCERARKLLATEIEFVPHASFRRRDTTETAADANRQGAATVSTEPARLGDGLLLDAEQERNLFRQMNYFKYRANALRATLDPDAPEKDAIETAELLLDRARSIRDQIVQANVRLVMSVVKKFMTPKHPFDELLSDGLLSLMKAVEKFDFSRGFRFSTYTHYALTRGLYRSIAQKARRESRRVSWSDERCDLGDEGRRRSPDEASWEALRGSIAKMLRKLDPRERFIVSGRFALGSQDDERTFQSLADDLKISKERVRQIEARALARLRGIAAELGLEESFAAALEGGLDLFSLPNSTKE